MFDMQNLTFFSEGNTFTGSKSQGEQFLRYLVRPDKENGRLLAWAWTEDLCYERAGGKEHQEFLLTEEGIGRLTAWLESLWEQKGALSGEEAK